MLSPCSSSIQEVVGGGLIVEALLVITGPENLAAYNRSRRYQRTSNEVAYATLSWIQTLGVPKWARCLTIDIATADADILQRMVVK